MRTRIQIAAAMAGTLALAACSAEAPDDRQSTPGVETADNGSAMSDTESVAAAEQAAAAQAPETDGRCTITEVAAAGASDGMEQIGSVGDLSFFANGADLMCSEPAGLVGDCQIADGKTVVLMRGETAYRITPNEPSTYLSYGPGRIECVAPPGPVEQGLR